MNMKKSHKRWLIAFVIIVLVVFVVEWLMSLNRTKTHSQDKDPIQNNVNK